MKTFKVLKRIKFQKFYTKENPIALDIIEDDVDNGFYDVSAPEKPPQSLEKDDDFWKHLSQNVDKDNVVKIESKAYFKGLIVPGPPFGIEPTPPIVLEKANSFLQFADTKLLLSFGSKEDLKDTDHPEIAFAGRSNVGKSSLINSIMNGPLTITSSTPGRTRRVNIFSVKDILNIVDLPGYGYAEGNEEHVRDWNKLIEIYIKYRRNLRKLFLLIDAKFDLFENDIAFLKNLTDHGIPTQIILTKCDKVKHETLCKRMTKLYKQIEDFPTVFPYIIPTSASDTAGVEELRGQIIRSSGLLEIGYFLSKEQKAKFEREEEERAKENLVEQKKMVERQKNIEAKKKMNQQNNEELDLKNPEKIEKKKKKQEKMEKEVKEKTKSTILGLD